MGLLLLDEQQGLAVPKKCSVNLYFIHHITESPLPGWADKLLLRMFVDAVKQAGIKPPKDVNLDKLTMQRARTWAAAIRDHKGSVLPPNAWIGGWGCFPSSLLETIRVLFGDVILPGVVASTEIEGQGAKAVSRAAYKQLGLMEKLVEEACDGCCPHGVEINVVCDKKLVDALERHVAEVWKVAQHQFRANMPGRTLSESLRWIDPANDSNDEWTQASRLLSACKGGPFSATAINPIARVSFNGGSIDVH